MAAYLLFSMPLIVLISAALRSWGHPGASEFTDSGSAMAGAFAPGALVGVITLLVLGWIAPGLEGSYRAGRLYLAALLLDQLVPLVFAAAGVVVLGLVRFPGWQRPRSFATGLAYLGGIFSMVSAAEYLSNHGQLTPQVLFLAPTLRIVVCCVYARALERWGAGGAHGPGWTTVAVLCALPPALALEGMWARMGRVGSAALLAAGFATMTFLGLALRLSAARPRGGAGR